VGGVTSSGEDDVAIVELATLVPVLLTERNHVGLDGKGSVPMTSENPDDWYWEPPTDVCDEQVGTVDFVGDDDLFVYFSAGDWKYVGEWLSGERVAAAAERYADGLTAAEACVDAGVFTKSEVSYPGLDEVHVYTKQAEEEWDRTVLYARNGGVVLLLTLGYHLADRLSEEHVERIVGIALGKFAALGRVEVAEGSSISDLPTTTSAPPVEASPPSEPPTGSGETTSPNIAVDVETTAVSAVTDEMLEASLLDEMLEASLLTESDLAGWELQGAPWVTSSDGDTSYRRCPNGEPMAAPIKSGQVWFWPRWTGEYDSITDDDVSERVYVFSSPDGAASWFDGFASCIGQEWDAAFLENVALVSLDRFDISSLGDESQGFRAIYSFEAAPGLDVYEALVRLDELLVVIDYGNYRDIPLGLDEPIDQVLFEAIAKNAVANVEAIIE
jgi:hypothetical protein